MTRRYSEIDTLKAVGILVVIFIHCIRPPWSPHVPPLELWLGQMTRFAVPGFLAASGFLYATTTPVTLETTLRRLRRIMIPYLIASIAAQLFLVLRGEGKDMGAILMDLLMGSSSGPFYFVFLITVLALATPIFSRASDRVIVALLLALLLWQTYDVLVVAPRAEREGANVFSSAWVVRSPKLWWSYFLLGWVARRNYEPLLSWVLARRSGLVAVLALIVAGLGSLWAFDVPRTVTSYAAWLNILAILMLVSAASCGRDEIPAPIRFLSEATYPIYLFHLFFVYLAQDHIAHAQNAIDLAAVFVPWAAGLIGALAIIAVGRLLLGERSRAILGA